LAQNWRVGIIRKAAKHNKREIQGGDGRNGFD
jgi:hypothetical protein